MQLSLEKHAGPLRRDGCPPRGCPPCPRPQLPHPAVHGPAQFGWMQEGLREAAENALH